MEINFINQTGINSWDGYRKYLEPILSKTLELLDRDKNVSVSVILVDREEIHRLNKTYRDADRPTDVLSFPSQDRDAGCLELGDIFINAEAVIEQARKYHHTLKREFCFLVVHGYLHLLGFDHHTEAEEKEMFSYQEVILNGIADRIYRAYRS